MKKALVLTLVVGLAAIAAPVQAEDGAIEAEPAPVGCSGDCDGTSYGFATSAIACGNLTQQQKDDLMDQACDNASATTAISRADEDCQARSTHRDCLCWGSFSEDPGAFTGWGSGCIATCKLTYAGRCGILVKADRGEPLGAAPAPEAFCRVGDPRSVEAGPA